MMRAGKAQDGSASSDRKWTSGPTANTRVYLLLADVESRLASLQLCIFIITRAIEYTKRTDFVGYSAHKG